MTSQDAPQPLVTSSPSTCSRPSDTWTLSTSATSSSRYNLATRNSSRKSSSRRGSHCAHSSNNKLKCTHNSIVGACRWPLISESRPRDVSPSCYMCPPTTVCSYYVSEDTHKYTGQTRGLGCFHKQNQWTCVHV